jgi:hypothetical protein
MQSLLHIYDLNAVNVVIKTGWNIFIFIDFVYHRGPMLWCLPTVIHSPGAHLKISSEENANEYTQRNNKS